jgi:hypothetical protein
VLLLWTFFGFYVLVLGILCFVCFSLFLKLLVGVVDVVGQIVISGVLTLKSKVFCQPFSFQFFFKFFVFSSNLINVCVCGYYCFHMFGVDASNTF